MGFHLLAQIDSPAENWIYATGNEIRQSGAALSPDESIMYIGSNDDSLYAINVSTGQKEWAYFLRADVESSPIVGEDGTIYAGAQANYFYAINPDGTLKWETALSDEFLYASAAIGFDGSVYAGCRNDSLYAFDHNNGTVKWRFKAGAEFRGTAAVGTDGSVYAASNDDTLYSVNPTTGMKNWSTFIGGNDEGGMAIDKDGTIYIGTSDDNLYSIDPVDGSINWTFETLGGDVLASPVIGSNGTIYVGSRNDSIYAINNNGTEKWRFYAGDDVRSTAAIDQNGIIYFGSFDDNVYGIRDDATQATQVFNFSTGGNVWSPITLTTGGDLLFGSYDGKIYSVTPTNTSGLANTPWPKRGRNNQHQSRANLEWNGSVSTDWNNASNWSFSKTPTASDNITISDVTNDPTISASASINDILVDASAMITINSGASLAIFGDATGSGQITVKRNSNGNAGYSIVGSPVSGADISDLSADYLQSWDGTNWSVPTGTMTPGKGYFVGYDASSPQISLTGSIISGDQSTAVSTSGDAFNLVANPYASAISINTFLTNNSNIDASVYLWNDGGSNIGIDRGGDYVTINSVGSVSTTDLGDGISGLKNGAANTDIASLQGFFVKANTNGNINFSPTMQNTTSGANADGNFYRTAETQSSLKLSLSGGHYNEVLFGFREDATEGVDRFFDAVKKIGNENFAFYSIIEDDKYAIQGLPEINGEMRIKLGYQLTESKEYKLSIKEIEGISNEYQVIANFNNKSYNLSNQDQLLFIEAGIGEIELIITNAIILSVDNPKELVIFKNSQERLNILVPSDIAKGTIQIIDMTGKTLLRYEDQIIENAHWSKNVNLKPNMIYILKFNSINGNYTRKFIY